MAPRKKAQASATTFDDMVAGAFARNGLNTILLDVKEDVVKALTKLDALEAETTSAQASRRAMHEKLDNHGRQLQGLKQTVDDIAPKVLVLDTERTEKIGVRRFFKKHYVIGAGAAGAIAAGWHQWEKLVALAGRVFR